MQAMPMPAKKVGMCEKKRKREKNQEREEGGRVSQKRMYVILSFRFQSTGRNDNAPV